MLPEVSAVSPGEQIGEPATAMKQERGRNGWMCVIFHPARQHGVEGGEDSRLGSAVSPTPPHTMTSHGGLPSPPPPPRPLV